MTAATTATPPWRRLPWMRSRAEAATPGASASRGSIAAPTGTAVPPLSPGLQFARAVFIMIFVIAVTMLLQLTLIGGLQQSAAQERKFDEFRRQLATGTAPIGAVDNQDRPVAVGSPIAYLEIPEIGLRQVVVAGTTSTALFDGPGHRRDTVLPGQAGASIIMGRQAAFGGPFGDIDRLEAGDSIVVTTGQGEFEYEVLGVRREGDPVPPPPEPGSSRLLLATADGRPYLPEGVLRVDADLVGEATGGPPRAFSSATLPRSEQFMGSDTSTLWALVLWIQLLIALTIGAVWAWHRWGRPQAWIVFLPPLLLVGLAASGQVARLLPNLL
ncbi:MAG TPA: class E sortase [Ilumatobacteraceae bacterium]|nr:class E sortase [Ilumatobacteraceae bacterium]